MKAGTLEIDLLMNLARLSESTQGAIRIVGNSMQTMERDIGRVKSALGALGVGLSAAGFTALIKGSIDAMDHLNDLSKSTNQTVEVLAGLRVAAKQSGGDLDGIAASINKLSVNMGKDAEKFRALGVTAKDPLEAFKQLADVFVDIKDPQLRAAVGAEALGKTWASAAPLLAEGGKRIGEMVEAGTKASGMTTALAKEADEFNDKLVLLVGSGGAITAMVGPLLPLLNKFADDLLRVRKETANLKSEFSPLLEIAKYATVVLGGFATVVELVALKEAQLFAQMRALASGDLRGFFTIGKLGSEDADAVRERYSKWRDSILAIGTAASSAAKSVKGMSEEDYEAARIAEDAAKAAKKKGEAFLHGADAANKAAKAMKDLGLADEHVTAYRKNAADEERTLIALMEHRTRLMRDQQQMEIEEIDARDAVLDRLEDGNAMLRVENATLGMTATARALYILKLEEERDIKTALTPQDEERIRTLYREREALLATAQSRQESLGMWDDLSDRVARVATGISTWTDELRNFGRELAAMLAKKWVLQLAAGVTGSTSLSAMAGQVGQGTLAGAAGSAIAGFGGSVVAGWQGATLGAGLAGPTTTGASIFSGEGIGAALAGMGPVGWAALAVAAVAAVAYAFRDKGENWRAQFGFGENAMAPYSTQGVFGTEGFAQIQGQDAFARAMQEFMAGTRELDEVLARHLSADSIDRIVASLAGPYATRADGQPSEFAFGRGQEAEAAAQLTLEYLQKKYGTIFDEIDGTFAEFIRSYTGKSEDLLAEIGAFVSILDQLSRLNIPGLDVGALRAMARDGEALGDTFARVSGEMSTMREQFLTDAEKLNLAQEALSGLFGDMALLGMRAPADNAEWLALFESLDLGIEAEREMHDRMVALAPAMLAVGDASERAAQQAQQAAVTMLASFDSVMGQLRGSPYTRTVMQGQLDSALGQFQGANSWSQGMSLDSLMGQLLTITRQDFQNYGADMQALITQILTLYSSLQSLTDPISTVGTAVGTILAPAIDTAAIAADHLNTKLGLLAQIYELNGDAVSAAAIKEHQRAIALEEIRRQDAAAGTIGELEGLTTTLWALQDAAAAAAEETRRREEIERENERAARGVIGTMQELVRMMDQVASFRDSLAGSIQSIRSQMPGFDAIGYQSGQVSRFRGQLAGAGSIEDRLAAAGKLRDAIMGRYQAEMDAANALHQQQENAARAAIDAANELNRAFRGLGDYAKSLLTGDLSTLSPGQKLAESGRQYQDMLARARGGDMAALGGLQGAASDYLTQARGYYASSDAYVRIFGEVQGALTELGARAGPEQMYQENTAAWQASLLDIQTRAIDELGVLSDLTDQWQGELQDQLAEQAIAFSNIDLNTSQMVDLLKGLAPAITTAINTAISAAVRANGEIAEVQMDRDDEWYERQYDATKKLPGQIASAVTVTDRR